MKTAIGKRWWIKRSVGKKGQAKTAIFGLNTPIIADKREGRLHVNWIGVEGVNPCNLLQVEY